jgi:DNA-binding MarR family transcriptional regulator
MSSKHVDIVNKKASDSPDEVFDSIHVVMHLFRSGQYRVLRDTGQNLTHMEGKILGFFARNPGGTLSDLVAHSGRDKGQLARLIRSLKDQGLLEARECDGDRRSMRLHLTSDGRAVHETLQRQLERLANVAVTGLSAEERQQFIALLHRVRANLEPVS